MIPAVSKHITDAAVKIVLGMLPGCPEWREGQILYEVTTMMGSTGNAELIASIKKALRRRGKHELEVEAIEDVLIRFYRERTRT